MKSLKKRISRCKTIRRRKFAKGGMRFRKSIINGVFGKTWFERVSKGNDIINAAIKGADAANKIGHRTPFSASASKSFGDFDSPRFRMSPPENRIAIAFNETMPDATPKKSSSSPPTKPPNLPTRSRRVETKEDRLRRLGSTVAPVWQRPVPVATVLFPD